MSNILSKDTSLEQSKVLTMECIIENSIQERIGYLFIWNNFNAIIFAKKYGDQPIVAQLAEAKRSHESWFKGKLNNYYTGVNNMTLLWHLPKLVTLYGLLIMPLLWFLSYLLFTFLESKSSNVSTNNVWVMLILVIVVSLSPLVLTIYRKRKDLKMLPIIEAKITEETLELNQKIANYRNELNLQSAEMWGRIKIESKRFVIKEVWDKLDKVNQANQDLTHLKINQISKLKKIAQSLENLKLCQKDIKLSDSTTSKELLTKENETIQAGIVKLDNAIKLVNQHHKELRKVAIKTERVINAISSTYDRLIIISNTKSEISSLVSKDVNLRVKNKESRAKRLILRLNVISEEFETKYQTFADCLNEDLKSAFLLKS